MLIVFGGNDRGNRVLVDQVLTPLAVEDDGEGVEAAHDPLELEAVGQVDCHGDLLAAGLVEENIL